MNTGLVGTRWYPAHVQESSDYLVDRTAIVPLHVSYCDVFGLLWPYANGSQVEKTVMVVTRDQSQPPTLYVLSKGRTRYDKFIFPGLEIINQGDNKKIYEIAQK